MASWTKKSEEWHGEVVKYAEIYSADLKYMLQTVDKIEERNIETVKIPAGRHVTNVSFMSEVLYRLANYLKEN